MPHSSPPPSPPPWEVLLLVGHRLDPKTLAIASCVCKSWFISMSSDHLWKPIFAARFPSLSNLAVASSAASPVAFRRLVALGHAAAARRRSTPLKPLLGVSDLVFAVSVFTEKDTEIICCAKRGRELKADPNGLFRFDINLEDGECSVSVGAGDEVRVTWNVVLEGWRGVFTMIECGGKLGLAPKVGGWFSEELPASGCCPNAVAGGIVADLKLGLGRNGRENEVRIEGVSVGMLSVVSWRYITMEDGLRYLQHFLLH